MLYNCEKIVFHIYIAYSCSELKVKIPLNEFHCLKMLLEEIYGCVVIQHSFCIKSYSGVCIVERNGLALFKLSVTDATNRSS